MKFTRFIYLAAKVIFLHQSVILLTGPGVCLSACWDTPPGSRHPPGTDTPRSRHPQEQTPPGTDNPPKSKPPCHSACWEIWAISGRYVSYWNAYLFETIVEDSILYLIREIVKDIVETAQGFPEIFLEVGGGIFEKFKM